ncbi:LacI family transcriptional regulator [Dyella acidisoli]|uniref:LacI family transcriptional regulator n=2 Tax=Dyella acidisoli TaxID=1867834 RepID=A0ABQ5XPZ1_9GAMM|nr:LacI family transcriptional regulator [Dyella acidisoli]
MTQAKKKQPLAQRPSLTMADLAELAGVSKITVSRALSESPLVNTETRERVQALARKHGYKLNVSARNLRLRRSHTVAVIVEMKPSSERTMWDPYPLSLLGGISQELTSAGYSVLLTTRQGASNAAVQAADGLILLGQGARQDAVRLYDKLGLPMVVWGAAGEGGDNHVVVGSDNHQGGIIAAERFLSIGRRHPVFIGNPDHPEMAQRLFGFVDELARHGIKPLLLRRADFTLESGVDAVRSLAARKVRFDAIFACSDLLAMGAIRALVELGQSVPNDVSVIGYDDTPLGATFLPPLSSVRQNWQEGGVLLARKVLAAIHGHPVQSQMMATTLVVRST